MSLPSGVGHVDQADGGKMIDDGFTTVPGEVEAGLVAVADEWARAIVSNDAVRIAGFMADDWPAFRVILAG